MQTAPTGTEFDPGTITRPDRALLTYYRVISLLANVALPFIFLPLLFKYKTLHYRFDEERVAMSWGVLFRKEIYLTYRRIQDIHVTRNILHRWLGLAAISIQTASGTAGAEMTIEGVRQVDLLRDYLYARMRGAKDDQAPDRHGPTADVPADDDVTTLLREIRDEVRALAGRSKTRSARRLRWPRLGCIEGFGRSWRAGLPCPRRRPRYPPLRPASFRRFGRPTGFFDT